LEEIIKVYIINSVNFKSKYWNYMNGIT
jgi:hypothetical protein